MKKRFKITSLVMAAVMISGVVFSGCGSNDKKPAKNTQTENDTEVLKLSENKFGLRDTVKDGTILQCWCWSFNTIKDSIPDIALAGYSTIQTSPINAVYDGGEGGMQLYGSGKWYYQYQPTDWTIGNYQLGTKEEFTEMCKVAHEYGIKVLVDVVPNHTTKNEEAISSDFINAVGGADKMYHSVGRKAITDYSDRAQCVLQGTSGLPDVDTENPLFQKYFLQYMNECIKCGADGFRFDTAKHIALPDDPKDVTGEENNFWENVLSGLDKKDDLFIYGEVLQDGSERIEDYIKTIGATTASAFGHRLRSSLAGGTFDANYFGSLFNENVVTWVESHDNYTGDDATYKKITNEQIALGWAIIAARADGTPLFFPRPYEATSTNMWGTMNRIGMSGDFFYKSDVITAINRFRNAMVGTDDKFYNIGDTTKLLAIERGTKGLCIVNGGTASADLSFETSLEDGTYINRVDNKTEFTVKNGKLTGQIAKKSVVILYNEGYIDLKPAAVVKIADKTEGSFSSDTYEVTLNVTNAESGTYSIDGKDEISYKDGDKITLGEGLKPGESTSLTLRAENSDKIESVMTYVFTKIETIKEGTKIYFQKPADWGDKVYAYVYDETSGTAIENKGWPGEEMTLEGDGKYCYTFTKEWATALVIFTDGTNQSNGALEPGADVVADKVYTVEK